MIIILNADEFEAVATYPRENIVGKIHQSAIRDLISNPGNTAAINIIIYDKELAVRNLFVEKGIKAFDDPNHKKLLGVIGYLNRGENELIQLLIDLVVEGKLLPTRLPEKYERIVSNSVINKNATYM